MKKSLLILLSSIQLLSGADEIVGLSLRSNSINIPVNPTAVAGAVLSLDANKRPVFSSGLTAPTATGSVTGSASTSFLDISGTWNTSGTPTGLKLNVTDTASNASSLLADFQVGSVGKAGIYKSGQAYFGDINGSRVHINPIDIAINFVSASTIKTQVSAYGFYISSDRAIYWTDGLAMSDTRDLILGRAAAANLRLGGDASATPVSQYFSVQNASGTNIAGADRYIDGSQSTGSANGGSIIFRTSPAGGAGTGTNALVTAFTAFSNGDCGFAGDTVYFGTSTPSAPKARIDFPGGAGDTSTIDLYNGYGASGTLLMRANQDATSIIKCLGVGISASGPLAFLYSQNAAEFQMGHDHATTPTAQTFKAHDVTTGTGASMTIAGGKGSVAGGSVILATSATNGSPVKRVIVHEGSVAATNTAATNIATISVDNGKSVGGELLVTVEAEESGHVTTVTEHSTFSAVANSGTVTAVIQTAPSTSTAASTNGGTLALVHGTTVPGGNTFTIQITPTSSYGGPATTIRYQLRLNTSDPAMAVTLP